MGCVPAPTCKAALAEATALWPQRSRASDGICGDPAHQARVSDHNQGNAFDLTDDPAHGCDAHAQAEAIRQRKDPRVKYIISRKRIAGPGSRGGGWEWKPYSGANPHVKHCHVSIYATARNSTAKWFTAPEGEEDEVKGTTLKEKGKDQLWLYAGGMRRPLATVPEVEELRKAGLLDTQTHELTAATLAGIPVVG